MSSTQLIILFDVHVTVHRDKFLIKNQIDALISQIYSWNVTLHFSDSSSVHHQEIFTVHTTMVCVIQVCWHILLMCVQWKSPDDGQRNCSKHVEFHFKNKFEKLLHLVGFIISNFIILNHKLWLYFQQIYTVTLRPLLHIKLNFNHHHHHHHVDEGLGVFPVPWSSRWSWSLRLFLDRPLFLSLFDLYCSACFSILFVSLLCTCCNHFSWYCFISFTMFCVPVF